MNDTIDIQGIEKAKLLEALHKKTKTIGYARLPGLIEIAAEMKISLRDFVYYDQFRHIGHALVREAKFMHFSEHLGRPKKEALAVFAIIENILPELPDEICGLNTVNPDMLYRLELISRTAREVTRQISAAGTCGGLVMSDGELKTYCVYRPSCLSGDGDTHPHDCLYDLETFAKKIRWGQEHKSEDVIFIPKGAEMGVVDRHISLEGIQELLKLDDEATCIRKTFPNRAEIDNLPLSDNLLLAADEILKKAGFTGASFDQLISSGADKRLSRLRTGGVLNKTL